MSKSSIEWTEETWNPTAGCSVLTPGCTHCYAMTMATRIEAMNAAVRAGGKGTVVPQYDGTTRKVNGNAVWTGKINLAPEATLLSPLRRRKPTMYFVNSMSDLFHDAIPDTWIDQVFAVMALAPQHTFQVLTKRASRMRAYCSDPAVIRRIYTIVCDIAVAEQLKTILIASPAHEAFAPPGPRVYLDTWSLPNVWLGVSAERQQEADARIPDLLATPAAVRFISAEPLLGPLDLITPLYRGEAGVTMRGYLRDHAESDDFRHHAAKLDWVIVGGESGHHARPMHPDWARSLRNQCAAAGTKFFFKQWGEWVATLDRDRDDPDWRRDYTNNYVDHGKSRWLNLAGGRGFHGERFHVMARAGKANTGRALDGIHHDEFPEPAR